MERRPSRLRFPHDAISEGAADTRWAELLTRGGLARPMMVRTRLKEAFCGFNRLCARRGHSFSPGRARAIPSIVYVGHILEVWRRIRWSIALDLSETKRMHTKIGRRTAPPGRRKTFFS